MQAASDETAYTKLTVNFYKPMYTAFNRQISTTPFSRDAFLDSIIASEIEHVRSDLQNIMVSATTKKYITGRLKQMGDRHSKTLHPVSINVRKTTAESLRKLVTDHNLVRDALLNWMLSLLRSSDSLLDSLELPKRINESWGSSTENMPTSPLKALEEILCDPFYYLRVACEQKYGCGLYAMPLPPELHGFACHLPDDQVKGNTACEEREMKEQEMNDLILSLDVFESSLSNNAKLKER